MSLGFISDVETFYGFYINNIKGVRLHYTDAYPDTCLRDFVDSRIMSIRGNCCKLLMILISKQKTIAEIDYVMGFILSGRTVDMYLEHKWKGPDRDVWFCFYSLVYRAFLDELLEGFSNTKYTVYQKSMGTHRSRAKFSEDKHMLDVHDLTIQYENMFFMDFWRKFNAMKCVKIADIHFTFI